jgi:hypothetical protein
MLINSAFPLTSAIPIFEPLCNATWTGTLCDNCRDTISHEIGTTVFYLAALCNLLELDLDTVIREENERIRTLGIYSLK